MYKKIVAFLCALSLLLPIGIHASDDLYLGGDSIGIQLDYNGVMITGTYPFVVQGETYDPGGTIQPSDILVKVNQVPISSMDCLLYTSVHWRRRRRNLFPHAFHPECYPVPSL